MYPARLLGRLDKKNLDKPKEGTILIHQKQITLHSHYHELLKQVIKNKKPNKAQSKSILSDLVTLKSQKSLDPTDLRILSVEFQENNFICSRENG